MKKFIFLIFAVSVLFLGLLNINNKALFNHNTSLYTDSFVNISLLKSFKYIPRIFTNEISLYTHGKYCPISFAIFALFRATLQEHFNPQSLHLFLLIFYLLCAFFVFLIIKEFSSYISALIVSVLFLFHPFFIHLLNDANQIPILLGLFFSLSSVFLYLVYLKKRYLLFFFASLMAFAIGILSSELAIYVPIFIMLFHQLALEHKKITLGISFYLIVLLLVMGLWQIDIFFLFIASLLFMSIFVLSIAQTKKEAISVFINVIPFLLLVIMWYVFSKYIGIKPVYQYPLSQMDKAHILKPFKLLSVWKYLSNGYGFYMLMLSPFLIIPFLLNGEKWQYIILGGFVIFFGVFSIKQCTLYKTDVTYWESIAKGMDEPVVMVNLAHAYIEHNRFEDAKKILYGLKYEREELSPLLMDTINVELGKLYHKLKKYKVSAYYFLQRPKGALPGASKIAKWRLIPIADFFFDLGYLSYAENFYASALVLDPYDPIIFQRLGKVLVYKNFFRAALRYFDKALEIIPYDKISLFFAAFASKIIGDKDRYISYEKRWHKITNEKLFFDKIYKKFSLFDKEKTRRQLSPDPVVMFYTGKTKKKFIYELDHRKYVFWEVPFEIGKYFFERKKYDAAIAFFAYASDISGGVKEVKEYLKMAQLRKMMPTQEEIIRAIKEREIIEKEMKKRGVKQPWDLLKR